MGKTMSENQQEVPEPTEAEMQAQFELGFAGGDNPPATPKTDEVIVQPVVKEEAKKEDVISNEESEPAPVLMGGLDETALKNLLAKAAKVDSIESEQIATRDRLYGKIGELNRAIQELKQQQQTPAKPAGVKLSANQFKRLSQDYPDLAEAIAEDFAELNVSSGEKDQPVDIEALITPRLEAIQQQIKAESEQQMELRLMSYMRPSWRDDVQSQDFTLFKSQLSPDVSKKFDESWDATYINDILSQYDAWKDKANTPRQDKSKRLEQAIQPRSTVADHTPSDIDQFEAGFKSVNGRKL